MIALLEPEPACLWPLAYVRAAEDRGGEVFHVLTLALPSGDLHYSDAGVNDETLGTIETFIVSWPVLSYGVHETEYRLPLPSYEVEIEDPEGTFAAELTGAQALGAFRAAATIRAGIADLSSSMWPKVFEGVVVDWATARRDVVRLILRHDYSWLQRPLLRHRVLRSDWPNADPTAIHQLIPVNVGTFDSRLNDGATALPTLYVDTRASEWLFLVQAGWCYDVFDVRLNGTVADLADYNLIFDTNRGLDYTAIKFLADPGADPVVTVDVTGLERVGDQTGAPLETPAEQLQHILVNFAYGDWTSGVRLDPASAPLDLASFAEADHFLEANRHRPQGTFTLNRWCQGRRTARAISTAIWGLDLVNEWCLQFGIRPYWTEAGKLALGVFDHRLRRIFLDGPHWIRDEDVAEGETHRVPSLRRARDQYESAPLSVQDPEAGWNSKNVLTNSWSQQLTEADLVPYVTTDEPTAWNIVGGGSDPHEAIADPPYVPDDDVSYAEWNAASATGTFRVRLRWASDGPAVPSTHRILAFRALWRAKYTEVGAGLHTMKVGVRVGGTTYFGTEQTLVDGVWTDYMDEWLLNPDTGDPWTMDELVAAEIEVSATHTASSDKPQITQLFGRVQFAAGGTAADLVRERLSRELLLGRQPPVLTETTVGLHRAAIRACDPVSVSSDAVQAPGALGWGVETWERRLHFMVSRKLDLANGRATMRLLDARDLAVPLWEIDQASAPAPEAPGVVRLGAWAAGRSGQPDGRRFSRPSDPTDNDPTGIATVNHPSGDGTYEASQDTEKYDAVGLLMQLLDTTPAPDLEADVLRFLVRHDNQVWPIEGGTAVFKFIVPALTAGTTRALMRCGSDVLHIVVDSTVLRFRRTVGGVDYDATASTTGLIAGQEATAAIRWTSREQELVRLDAEENEEPTPRYTLDVWLNGVKGTGVTGVEGFFGDLYIGSDAGIQQLQSEMLSRRVWRQVLRDEEVEAEMATL